MIDTRLFRRTRRAVAMLALGTAACAPARSPVPGSAPAPEPLTEQGIDVAAALLEMADRREYHSDVIDAAMASAEPTIRRLGALTAARIAAPESRPQIRELLRDEDTTVVATAAFALGELVDSSAVPLLIQHLTPLETTLPSVAAEVAEALGKIASDEARVALGHFLLTADTAEALLVPVIRAALIGAWRAGESTMEPFSRWLAAADPEIRWRAVYGLSRRQAPAAVQLLLPHFSDPHPLSRAFALRGLHAPLVEAAGVPNAEVLKLAVPLLEDSSYAVRIEAIRMVTTFGPGPGFDEILEIVRSSGNHERAAAIEALKQLGQAAGSMPITLLRRIAADRASHAFHREIAIGAAAAVDSAGATVWLRTLSMDPEWRVRAAVARAFAARDDSGVRDLEPFFGDPDPRVTAATINAIAQWEEVDRLRGFRNLLLESLHAEDLYVRAAALEASSALASPALFSTFLDSYQSALSDHQNDAQLAAIDAIASLAGAGVPAPERAFLLRFDSPGDYLVRQRALLRFGAAARQAWGEAFPISTGVTPRTYDRYIRDWIAPADPVADRPRVRIEMNAGSLDLELYSEAATLTVENFLTLARARYFDGQEWPRVVPNFVVQGGDPRGDTSGGPGYSIRDEINRHLYAGGVMGMALSGPDTGGSQFFITHTAQPHLDGTYTVFGMVISGHELLESILPGDRIIRVTEIHEDDEL